MTLALPQVQYAVFKVHMTLPIFIFPYMGKDVKFSALLSDYRIDQNILYPVIYVRVGLLAANYGYITAVYSCINGIIFLINVYDANAANLIISTFPEIRPGALFCHRITPLLIRFIMKRISTLYNEIRTCKLCGSKGITFISKAKADGGWACRSIGFLPCLPPFLWRGVLRCDA